MTPSEIDQIRDRITRAFNNAKTTSGSGYETSYVAAGTSFVTKFKASGVKSPDQLNDDLLNLFIWLWSIKDYIKAVAEENGKDPKEIESLINSSKALTYVSDIANRAKHLNLSKSRSGEFCELVDVGWVIPQNTLSFITVQNKNVTMAINDPSQVKINAFIVTNQSEKYDAFVILGDALDFVDNKLVPYVTN